MKDRVRLDMENGRRGAEDGEVVGEECGSEAVEDVRVGVEEVAVGVDGEGLKVGRVPGVVGGVDRRAERRIHVNDVSLVAENKATGEGKEHEHQRCYARHGSSSRCNCRKGPRGRERTPWP